MELSVRGSGGISIIDVNGKIDMDMERKFRDQVNELLATGNNRLVFNFKNCGYLCSPALGVIAISIKKARETGGDVKLLNVNEYLHNIFEITKLTQIVDFFNAEEMAIASFK